MTTDKRKIDPTPIRVLDGLPWVANTSLVIDGFLYQRGCIVPDEVLNACPNREALIENRRVLQRPKPVDGIKPRPLEPTPATSFGNEPVVFRATGNPLEDWDLSVAATMEQNNCPRGWAVELLTGDSSAGGGGELYRLATKVDAEQRAITNRTYGRRPVRAL
jgi:hypothetical protein